MSDFSAFWSQSRERVEAALESVFSAHDETPERTGNAMRYATLNGGKRFRAMLVYGAGMTLQRQFDDHAPGINAPDNEEQAGVLDVIASAVEMVHAYSLVHDDLPAMDDDDLRRGRPTCHRAFDEATAILAGDALLTLAFELLASDDLGAVLPERRLMMVRQLSMGAGASGMVGGQSLDIDATGKELDLDQLMQMHRMKTGALIRSSCVLGGLAVNNASLEQIRALEDYGDALGMTFQIVDDILDVTADSDTLGKASGADSRMEKNTFVSLLGLEGATKERDRWHQKALESIAPLGDNDGLFHHLANFAVARSY